MNQHKDEDLVHLTIHMVGTVARETMQRKNAILFLQHFLQAHADAKPTILSDVNRRLYAYRSDQIQGLSIVEIPRDSDDQRRTRALEKLAQVAEKQLDDGDEWRRDS